MTTSSIIYISTTLLALNYFIFLFKINSGLKKQKDCSAPKEEKNSADYFISVIIPFHNEKNNIINSLKSVTSQSISPENYEVIYVNDNSSDGGDEILKQHIEKNNVYVYNNFPAVNNKKAAIELGISKAKGDIIILSDADCIQQAGWLHSLLQCLDNETGFIAGPVEFYSNASVFSNLQQLEFASLIIAGAGLINCGMPAICNGANVLFRKSLFYRVNGYEGNENISSGDDVFLMQKIARLTDYKIAFCNTPESIVRTYPQKTIGRFFKQRKRWAGKSISFLDKKLVAILAGIFFFYSLLFISPLLIINNFNYLWLFASAFILKMAFEYVVIKSGAKAIPLSISFKYFLPAEVLHIPYIVLSTLYGTFGKKSWK
jgi:cellulose synthase/poly-beta-1,6-N-acetylglucosamine synthase-like glycosyltransferase